MFPVFEVEERFTGAEVFEANGTSERDAALVMLEQIPGTKQVTDRMHLRD